MSILCKLLGHRKVYTPDYESYGWPLAIKRVDCGRCGVEIEVYERPPAPPPPARIAS